MASNPARRARLLVATSFLALIAPTLIVAQSSDRNSLNFNGATGLIDMPSGEQQPDAYLTITSGHFGPVSRTTLSFQITPRMSASFRFMGIRQWNAQSACQPDCSGEPDSDGYPTYYDRSFDFRYQLLKESKYVPAFTIGLQDLAGTGVLSGEFVAATKHITPDLKVTAGLGWGRLGSYGSIGAPFGDRDPIDIGEGGNFNAGQWFRGDAAPFAGVEWRANDRLTLKAEYSSDAYYVESERRGTFDRKSPFNFGAEYTVNEWFQIGGYYMYGSELGIAAHFTMNPKNRPMGGIKDGAPDPVKVRPTRAADPEAYSTDWVTQADAASILIINLNKRLKGDGVEVEAISYTKDRAQVRIRNIRYDAEAQAIGRVARAMSYVMPESVEVFEIVPMVAGMPASKVELRRSDLERLEHSPTASDQMRAAVTVSNPGARPQLTYDAEKFPDFRWSLSPYNRIRLFDQRGSPFKMDVGARLSARYEFSPGWVLEGAAVKRVVGNLANVPPTIDTGLQPVRSDVERYDANGDPAIERITLSKYMYFGGDVYGRLSLGYLERMFGGVSGEVLYKPVDRKWALGAELNYVAQRDSDGMLGFSEYDYQTVSGHVSAYYAFAEGYHAQLDVGRYLAGDIGATLSLDREFANGWRVGAFATKTNVSADDFGSGSFDKGIRLEVPLAWGLGTPGRKTYETVIRPFGRDGGARLNIEGRLYDTVRDYHTSGIDDQWGRFWK
ncbi:YjbH domain-containing protein [Gemmobacter lanyuensis]|uniref:YjbH domain-containing protein n=1 Tax=Gemmobacter lanyuensis TaxID=1054497 RepID=UPI00167BE07E|nr:YjbH domain-containing protein [Gemmobacter lanyuensis]